MMDKIFLIISSPSFSTFFFQKKLQTFISSNLIIYIKMLSICLLSAFTLILILALTLDTCRDCSSNDEYFSQITSLAPYDGQLSTRLAHKTIFAIDSIDSTQFAENFQTSNIKESGFKSSFAGASTRSWVSEIFVGLKNQYLELIDQDPKEDSYKVFTGYEFLRVFEQNKEFNQRLIYQLKFQGTFDHDWIVEQLSNGGGYRIYQSRQDAYNLNAWLSKSQNDLFQRSDVMNFVHTKESTDLFIKLISEGNSSLINLTNLPSSFTYLYPYFSFIARYDKTEVENNFKASWEKYGGGQILKEDWFFENYLKPLASLIDYLRENNLSSKLFQREYYDNWTRLFGSPNTAYYPNIPFKAIIGNYFPSYTPLQFMMKTLIVDSDPKKNADIIRKALQICKGCDIYFPYIKSLAPYDGQLSTRLGHKTIFAYEQTSQSAFVEKIQASPYKESGFNNSFTDASTRSWVSEIFVGVQNQYLELLDQDPKDSAYTEYTDKSFLQVLELNKGSDKHIIYQLKFQGTQDHDWIIEQLPENTGYRVYQSYQNAFNLNAWLSDNVSQLYEKGDMMNFIPVKEKINNLLIQLTGGSTTLSNLSSLPERYSSLTPYFKFVAQYDQKQVETNFRSAWEKFGAGKIFDTDWFFQNYLSPLATLIDYIWRNNLSTNIFSEDYYNLWIQLFGSPTPLYFSGIPFNSIAGNYYPTGTPFQFMMKVVTIGPKNDPEFNTQIIMYALQQCKGCDIFIPYITSLAQFDGKLSTRLRHKTLLALASSKSDFASIMENTYLKERGTKDSFGSGLTRSWVSEIFTGLQNQYLELINQDPIDAAYKHYNGSDLINVFKNWRGSYRRIIYQLRYIGAQEHDWIIEQLPQNSGYRIYQSYHNAYNLKSWLSDNIENLFQNGDLMDFVEVRETVGNFLFKLCEGRCSLTNLSLASLPSKYWNHIPYFNFIAKYDQKSVEENFRAAWDKLGKGQVLETEWFFTNYLEPTGKLVDYLKDNNYSSTIFSESFYNSWTSLYGSPNIMYFKDLPFNAISGLIFPQKTQFKFMMKVIEVNSTSNPALNTEIIKKALLNCTDCDIYFPQISSLAQYDSQLSTRLSHKTFLAKKASSQMDFQNNINFYPFKESGFKNSFTSSFTRSWVSEIFSGVQNQYLELLDQEASGVGYVDYTGDKFINLFKSNRGSNKRIIYQLKYSGTQNHQLIIEQLPFNLGYRVYQSYNDAFSLNAWLSDKVQGLYDRGDLVNFNRVKQSINNFLKQITQGRSSLDNLWNLPDQYANLLPYFTFIANYNQSNVENNFKAAWQRFGGGNLLEAEWFFKNYLNPTSLLVDYLRANNFSSNTFSEEMFNLWIALYGSPIQNLYKNLSFNSVAGIRFPYGANFQFMIKVVQVPEGNYALKNTDIVRRALQQCMECDIYIPYISSLASFDSQLSSRSKHKTLLAKNAENIFDYVGQIESYRFKENGAKNSFSANLTRSWVSEVFVGARNQYQEILETEPQGQGYQQYSSDDFLKVFKQNKGSYKQIIYQIKFQGTSDHELIIEQLPQSSGYRVYQSYRDAYNLKAWLSTTMDGLFDNGDLMNFIRVKQSTNNFVKELTSGVASLDNLQNLPDQFSSYLSYFTYIANYNQQNVESNFRAAWERFGGGNVLQQEWFFENYLNPTATLIDYLQTNNQTSLFSPKMYNLWTSLYGSPNTVYYENLPFQAIAGRLYPVNTTFRLMMKVISENLSSFPDKNTQIIRKSLQACNYCDTYIPYVQSLAPYDGQLSTRISHKAFLAKQAENVSEFVAQVESYRFKESGPKNSSAGSPTRSWLSEIYTGVKNQYLELLQKDSQDFGYTNYTGDQFLSSFKSNNGSNNQLIYQLKFEGTHNHEWVIEQFPNGSGYRVYQSFQNAYSLNAWLSDKIEDLFQNGDLMDFVRIKDTVNAFIQQLTNGTSNLSNLTQLSDEYSSYRPYFEFVQQYGRNQVENNFKPAWLKYGGGNVLDAYWFLENYLKPLATLTDYLRDNNLSSNLLSEEMFNLWISLFGSPDPFYYKSLSFKAVAGRIYPQGMSFYFTMKVFTISSANNPEKNTQIIKKALQACFYCDIYLPYVSSLAPYDNQLSTRPAHKKFLAQKAQNISDFGAQFDLYRFKENGRKNSSTSSSTNSWVSEIFTGVQNQYSELLSTDPQGFGYQNYTGDQFLSVFKSNMGSNKRFLYQLRFQGTHDLDWQIEQLPNDSGYRVYQSYQDAYSLNAWLSDKVEGLFASGELRDFNNLKEQIDLLIKKLTSGAGSLDDLSKLPVRYTNMIPYFTFVASYNQFQVESNFKAAWEKFGGGNVLETSWFFDKYLKPTATLADYLRDNNLSSNIFSKDMYNTWTTLYGSPNPYHYKDTPFDAIAGQIFPAQTPFYFQMKIVTINSSNSPESNTKLIYKALQSCNYCDVYYLYIESLAPFDGKLSTRYASKTSLAKAATGVTDFANKVKSSTQKEKGTIDSYSCSSTRSWVSEVFLGISNHYLELLDKDPVDAAYTEYTGQNFLQIFKQNQGSDQYLIYQLKYIGSQDHDWIIEQLPKSSGYRIYQTFNDAFNLNAWLSDSMDGLFANKDLMIFTDVKSTINNMLRNFYGCTLQTLDKLSPDYIQLLPYLQYIRDYNQTFVENNFRTAWEQFGGGNLFDTEWFLTNYIEPTSRLIDYLKVNNLSSTIFTQQMYNLWISLYGSPTPYYYFDITFKAIAEKIFPQNTNFQFKMKIVTVSSSNDPAINTNLIKKAI